MTTKYRVSITKIAESDIESIWSFIAQDSKEKAIQYIIEIENKIKTLENYPNRCPIISESELLGINYRHLLIGNNRIIFKVEQNAVFIMRVVHISRLLDTSLIS